MSTFRNWARRAVDGMFCSSAPSVKLIGDNDTGWFMDTALPPSVIYCAGVGQGISFELELAKSAPRPLLLFDPSPTGIATMATCDPHNLEFYPVGLAAENGVVTFSPPRIPEEGSFSVARENSETISFECWNLATIMAKHGDTAIDLLKMDIEGFEYDIIERFLADRLPVRQLCVEFHPWLRPNRTFKCIASLYRAGYRIVHKKRGDHTFVLSDSRFKALQQH